MTTSNLPNPPPAFPEDVQFLIEFAKDQDILCPACDYNLRDLSVPRCPECGLQLALKVSLVYPRLGSWLLMVVPLLMVTGVGVYAAVVLVTVIPYQSVSPGPLPYVFAATVPFGFTAVYFRRWFSRQSAKLRAVLTMLSLAWTLTLILWFIMSEM